MKVTVRWNPFEITQTDFSRPRELWYDYNSEERTRSYFQRLTDPSFYSDKNPPDYILIAPVLVNIRLEVVSDKMPEAYASVGGGRGNYRLPLQEVKARELYTVNVLYSDGTSKRFEVPLEAGDPLLSLTPGERSNAIVERAKTKALAELTARNLQLRQQTKIVSATIDSHSQGSGSEKIYVFDFYIPVTVPSSPKRPFAIDVFVMKDGECFNDRKEFTVLEQRLSPGLNSKSAAAFMASVTNEYFERYGFALAAEKLKGKYRGNALVDFRKWYYQYAAPNTAITGTGMITILDELISSHKALRDPKYTYDMASFVYEINEMCATEWLDKLLQAFLGGQTAIKTTKEEELISYDQISGAAKEQISAGAVIKKVNEPGSPYGDSYYVAITQDKVVFVGEDGSVYNILAVDDVPAKEPGSTPPPDIKKIRRQEFEKFLLKWNSVVATIDLLYKWAITPKESALSPAPVVIRKEFSPELVFVPVLRELEFLGLKLPDLMYPALGEPGTFAMYDSVTLQKILSDTVFAHWSGELFKRFGEEVTTYPEYNKLMEDAKRVMSMWNELNQTFKDSRSIVINATERLKDTRDPQLIYAYKTMLENASGVRFERLPYDSIWFLPPLWWAQRIRRYLGLEATYSDLYGEAKSVVGFPPSTSGPYWTRVAGTGSGAIDYPTTKDYLFDMLYTLRTSPDSISDRDKVAIHELCVDIRESSEIKNRFPDLFNLAGMVLNAIDNLNYVFGSGVSKYDFGFVQGELLRFSSTFQQNKELTQKVIDILVSRGVIGYEDEELHRSIMAKRRELLSSKEIPVDNPNIAAFLSLLSRIDSYIVRRSNLEPTRGKPPGTIIFDVFSKGSPEPYYKMVYESDPLVKYPELLPLTSGEVSQYFALLKLPEIKELIHGEYVAQELVDALVYKRYAELSHELAKTGSAEFTERDRAAFLDKIEKAKQTLPQYIADNISRCFIVDFNSALEASKQFCALLSDRYTIERFIKSPWIESLQIQSRLIEKTDFWNAAMREFHSLMVNEFYNDFKDRIFLDREKLESAVDAKVRSLWERAAYTAARGEDLGFDPNAVFRQLELYFGGGYVIFHLGQRVVSRILIGTIF